MLDALLWPLHPISEAPIEEGEPFGPCLLSPGLDGEDYVIGMYDGRIWHSLDAYTRRLEPTHYAGPLPPRSTLLAI